VLRQKDGAEGDEGDPGARPDSEALSRHNGKIVADLQVVSDLWQRMDAAPSL